MGLDRQAIVQVRQIAKNSNKMSKALKKMEDNIVNEGNKLIEEAGIDPNVLAAVGIDIRSLLRGESPMIDPSAMLTPEVICAMPVTTVQQREQMTRRIEAQEEKLQNIVDFTNNVKDQILALEEPILKLQEKSIPVAEQVAFISDIVEIIKILAIPTSVPPGAGVPMSVPNTFSSTLITLSDYLKIAKAATALIPAAIQTMTGLLNQVAAKINKVSNVVNPFYSLLTMIQSVVNLQDQCPLVTQGQIDQIGQSISNRVQGSLATAAFLQNPFGASINALEESLKENAPNPVIYKNWRFILEENPNPPFEVIPSRRIKCVRRNSVGINDGVEGYGNTITIYNNNPQTNPYLEEGAYSYASNINVLIKEAQFAVDVYTANVTIFEAPQTRTRVSASSTAMIDFDDLSEEDQQLFIEYYGFKPSQDNEPLPKYIRYGGNVVTLNNSPTDIAYGSDALTGRGFEFGSGQTIAPTSYITSGTIQVNAPISLKMRTFGGTGNPNASGIDGGGDIGYTRALLTIKRSTAIQDNINPYTGRITGVDDDAITDFINKNGNDALSQLEIIYQAIRESTITRQNFGNSDGYFIDNLLSKDFLRKLEATRDMYFGIIGTSLTSMRYRTRVTSWVNSGIFKAINVLYAKLKPMLYDAKTLEISQRLFGTDYSLSNSEAPGDQTNKWIRLYSQDSEKILENDGSDDHRNQYLMARKNSVGEGTLPDGGQYTQKAATIGMAAYAFRRFKNEYMDLFGATNNYDYAAGGWVGGATSVPLIPTSVSSSEDVEVILFDQQANRDETKSERVGGLNIIGTYSYDLEIIDSVPAVGGAESNYPTNWTSFTIEEV